jgi:hypothetical protein
MPTPIAVYFANGTTPPGDWNGPGWWLRFELANGDWLSYFVAVGA